MPAAYANVAATPSKFWGAPVLTASDGTVYCPGYTGNTYSKNAWDFVTICVPYNSPSLPQTPGICEVTCDKARDVDKKKKKGSDGARITLAGLEPALVDIRVTIWTPQQLLELDILRAIIFPGPQKKSTTTTTGGIAGTTSDSSIKTSGDTVTQNPDGTYSVHRNYGLTVIPQVSTIKKTTTTKSVTVTQPFDVQHPVLDSQGVRSLIFVRTEGPVPGSSKGTMVYTLKAIEFSQPLKGVNATTTPTGSKGAAPLPSTLDDTSGLPPGNTPGATDP